MAVIKNKQIKNYPFDSTIQTSESKSQRILLTCTDGRIQKSEHWFWWAVCPGLLSEDRVGEGFVAEVVSAFHQSSPGEGLWGWTIEVEPWTIASQFPTNVLCHHCPSSPLISGSCHKITYKSQLLVVSCEVILTFRDLPFSQHLLLITSNTQPSACVPLVVISSSIMLFMDGSVVYF